MSNDNHVELTAEIRQIVEAMAETKYNNKEQHPSMAAAIHRLKQALHRYGKQGLLVEKIGVSEEVREKLYDNELRPLLERLEQSAIRYSMPLQVVLEWGDDGQCAMVTQADRTPCARLQHVMLAASADGDIDLFMAKIGAIARVVGHNSRTLEQLGIPREPDPDIQDSAAKAGI